MIHKGFKMKLYDGMAEEYEKRHNELWPEMKDMIHEHGGKNYSIFLDKETMVLYGYIEIEDEELWAKGADTAINRKWWDFMADIMETNPVMIDGTGMCGGCRVIVGGETKFACVDGPDFDGHKIDWDTAMKRGRMFKDYEEKSCKEGHCRIGRTNHQD